MLEEYLVQYCAPTLAGIKTASLFSYPNGSAEEICCQLSHYNQLLSPKGIRLKCMRSDCRKSLIYVYRPVLLANDLCHPKARAHLEKLGYTCKDPEESVIQLTEHLSSCKDFPHEIGFFLGYPVEDVIGFIRYGGRASKCSGCWQVYHNVEAARRRFEQLHKCTQIYCRCYRSGAAIHRLVVAS